MEKQPVDDLFARKLRGAEAPVGPDVFSQLQQRQGTKPLPARRPIFGWWSVASAACLCVAIWFMYMSSKTEQRVDVPIVTKQTPRKTLSDKVTDPALAAGQKKQPQKQDGGNVARVNEASGSRLAAATAHSTHPTQKMGSSATKAIANAQLSTSPNQVTERTEMGQPQENQSTVALATVPAGPIPIERIDVVRNTPKQATERTIVLTIEEPQLVTSLAAVRNNVPAPDSPPHPNGISGLFGKIKQLKNGEVLAKATPAGTQNNPRNRFGRVFTDVKESLKNETTLE